jgi:hypothetical protein
MEPLGHFALGFICGTIIMLAFCKERAIYDYEIQKWVYVEYVKVMDATNNKKIQPITNELCPLTHSYFFRNLLIVATLCAFIAILPDYGQLWGNPSTDHPWWCDLFFFHRSIDSYSHAHATINIELLIAMFAIELCIFALTIACTTQNNHMAVR